MVLYHQLYFILILKQSVPTFDDQAKGFTAGKICSSINSIAGFDVPTETSKDHLGAEGTDTNDPYSIINNLKIKNPNRVVIAHININSLRNKFDILSDIVKNKIDILCIFEIKLMIHFHLLIFLFQAILSAVSASVLKSTYKKKTSKIVSY